MELFINKDHHSLSTQIKAVISGKYLINVSQAKHLFFFIFIIDLPSLQQIS